MRFSSAVQKNKAVFVTGTDTGVGKTLIAACLSRYLIENGHSAITQKWVQTGSKSSISPDVKFHLKMIGVNALRLNGYLNHLSPYVLKEACSPHLSARLANKRIDIKKIINSFKILNKKFDFLIVEGTGGALVPYSKENLLIDLVKRLNLSVIVVAENRLGAINHTLLTVEALRARNINILGIVFNNLKREKRYILEDNIRIIKELSNARVLGALPREPNYCKLYRKFLPIGKNISKYL